jgi:hypothetical protein
MNGTRKRFWKITVTTPLANSAPKTLLTDHDCIIGTIDTPGLGKIRARWNDVGICRSQTDQCNLNVSTPEVADVVETAKKLGA